MSLFSDIDSDFLGFLFVKGFFIMCCIFILLGLWKLIEIVVWTLEHINLTFN